VIACNNPNAIQAVEDVGLASEIETTRKQMNMNATPENLGRSGVAFKAHRRRFRI
jgi:hypothetical protein